MTDRAEKEFDVIGLLPSLRRFARSLEGDPERSQQLVQRTFRRAISELPSYRTGTDVRRWLFRLMLEIVELRASHGKVVSLPRPDGPRHIRLS
ncbi:sigma factor [Ensifer sp. 4252]|uniref:sigma factor n=1 Tax=Ensifer sp. 4252 TaxID=3373915 RepID=UPI003D197F82